MDKWSTREFGEWEAENAVRTNARRSEIVQWSEKIKRAAIVSRSTAAEEGKERKGKSE